MKADHHLHTHLCGHAKGRMREYVEVARKKRLAIVGFADHLPLLDMVDSSLTMSREQLPLYVEKIMELQAGCDDIEIKLGIEADYKPDTVNALAEVLSRYEFDYIFGSVHFMGDWVFDNPCDIDEYEKHDIDDLYRRYFELVGEAVETGLFDIVSHPDLIKKFDKRSRMDPRPLYRELLEKVKEMDMCYEVNTAGLRWPVGEAYPERSFLEMAFSLEIPVTVGSDAHQPDEVAYGFDEALDLISDVGYREIVTFSNRVRIPIPLE